MGDRRKALLKILAAVAGLILVLAILSPLLGLPAIAGLLGTGQFKLEGIRRTQWLADGDLHSVPRQLWRHVESGSLLEVDFVRLKSSELAASACQTQVMSTSLRATAGAFNGVTIGDECSHWLTSESARMLVRSGRTVVNLHTVGSLPEDVTTLLEDVATRILRYVR
ncbi:MAG: hypothetical protein ACM3WU_11125 [Bacillota bacterium]